MKIHTLPINQMMQKKHKISYLSLTMMLLFTVSFSSCEKEKIGSKSDQIQIVFGDVETRLINSSDDMKGAGGFGVFASFSGAAGTSAVATYSHLMENENVYWDNTNNVWTYDNTQYWVKSRNYHFFAYHPYEAEFKDTKPISAVEMNADFDYKLTFTTPETANYDLLTGFTTIDTGDAAFNGETPVPISFGHEMVNVNLEIWRDADKHQNDKMRVTGVALSNIPWKGKLTKTVSGVSSWADLAMNPLFLGTGVQQNVEIGAARRTSSVIGSISGNPCKPFGDNGLLLIPKANAVTLMIAYELQRQNGDTWESYTLPVTLPVDTWVAGKRVYYSLLLSNEVELSFYYLGTSVQSWGAPQVGGTIIIK